MPIDLSTVKVHIQDKDNIVASSARVMVQVRTGAMTRATLSNIESVIRLKRVQSKEPLGLLAIIEESAEIPDGETRDQQREVMRALLEDSRSYAVGVLEGDTFKMNLSRSVIRVFVMGKSNFKIESTVPKGAAWIADKLSLPASDVLELAEYVRGLSRGR